MKVRAIECGRLRPLGGRLWDGTTPGRGPANLVCRCLVVETPDGLALVDTGFGLRDVEHPGTRLSTFFLTADRPELEADDTAVSRLRQMGLDPRDVRHILMTHLDYDHAGGIDDFPGALVHVHAVEAQAARSRTGAIGRARWRPQQLPLLMQEYATPTTDFYGMPAIGGLRGLPEGFLLLPLPGHTPGHCGVAIRLTDGWLVHAGDAVFFHSELEDRPRCPPLARAYQRMMETNRAQRHASRRALRDLRHQHGHEVTITCTHDPVLPPRVAARIEGASVGPAETGEGSALPGPHPPGN